MVPQTTSRWMSITLNWNSSVVETNTLVSFTVHCRVHLGHTYHTYPSLRDEPTTVVTARCRRWPPDTSHTRSNARSHTPLLSTARYVAHGRTPACIRRRRWPPVSLHTLSYACSHTPSSLTAVSSHTQSYACSHTPSSLTARFVAHTVVRLLAYAVVVKWRTLCTTVQLPANILDPGVSLTATVVNCQAGRSTLRSTLCLYNTHVA